jgi:glycosyltransferase involved in cell wall biosynthesis
MTCKARQAQLVVIGHDASRTGAPLHLLRLLEWLSNNSPYHLSAILLRGGPLSPDYANVCPTTIVDYSDAASERVKRVIARSPHLPGGVKAHYSKRLDSKSRGRITSLCRNADIVYANTIVSGLVMLRIPLEARTNLITHLHEMKGALHSLTSATAEHRGESFETTLAAVLKKANVTLVPSNAARRDLGSLVALDGFDVRQAPPCLPMLGDRPSNSHVNELRYKLDIPSSASVIVGCGSLDANKGADLFIQLGIQLLRRRSRPLYLIWVGGWEPEKPTNEKYRLETDVGRAGLTRFFRFLPYEESPESFFCMADVLALTSREDSFPLVALEAAAVGTPIVCFESSGAAEFLEGYPNLLAPHLDIARFAELVQEVLDQPVGSAVIGRQLASRAGKFAVNEVGPSYNALFDRVLRGRCERHGPSPSVGERGVAI